MHCNSFFTHTTLCIHCYRETEKSRQQFRYASMQIWKTEDYYPRLRFVSPHGHLFPHCCGTFSISFFLSFILFLGGGINSTWLPKKTVNACTLLCKYKPRLELPEFSAEAIESAMQKTKLWQ